MKFFPTKNPEKKCHYCRGFSLVEIIVAAVILVISSLAFQKFVIGTKRGIEFTEEHLRAYLFADHLITALQIKANSSTPTQFQQIPNEFNTAGDISVIDSLIPGGIALEPRLCGNLNGESFAKELASNYKTYKYNILFEPANSTLNKVDGNNVSKYFRHYTITVKWKEHGNEKKIMLKSVLYGNR